MRVVPTLLFLAAIPLSAATLRDVPRAYVATSDRMQVADFDRDGNPDVITDGTPSGSILYGRADGSFEPPVLFGTNDSNAGPQFTSIAVADFDRDGLPDFVFRNSAPAGILLRHNLGGRRFEDVPLQGAGAPLAAADFTGDGAPDLLCRGAGTAEAILLLNDGRGSLSASRVLPDMKSDYLGLGDIYAPAIGDLDGDGDLDLVFNRAQELRVFLNDGGGNFEQRPPLDSSATPIAADLNGDRRSEIVALRYGRKEVAVYSSANPFAQPVVFHAGTGPLNGVAGDYNNDGALDLAVLQTHRNETDASSVVLYLGDGRGGLSRASEVLVSDGSGIAAADMNHDGVLDLLVPSLLRGDLRMPAPILDDYVRGISVVFGNGDGTFRVPSAVRGIAGAAVRAAADFDGDGVDELLVGKKDLYVGWMNDDGSYRFDAVPVAAGENAPVVAGGGKLLIAANNIVHLLSTSAPGHWSDAAFHAGDVVRALQLWPDRIGVIAGSSFKVFSATGALLDTVSVPSPAKQPFGRNEMRIDAADVDRNGTTDVLITALGSFGLLPFSCCASYQPDGWLVLLRGRADGTFAPPEVLTADRRLFAAAVADFNADGWVDIELAEGASSVLAYARLSTLFGNGSGQFAERAESIGFVPELIADFNLDGLPDFKKRSTIVFGGPSGKLVRYHDAALGSVVARRKRTGAPSLVGSVPLRGDLFFVDLVPDSTRNRAARH